MRLEGLHHITMITGDARKNVEFYADVLGLRLVKKTVNFDAPDMYHFYFGDEQGSPGSILTWFEFAGVTRGQAGAGDIHTIQLAVGGEGALEFWETRLQAHAVSAERGEESLRFEDYDGLQFELAVTDGSNPPLRAAHPDVPERYAIVGVEGARAYGEPSDVARAMLLDVLGFTRVEMGDYRLDGDERHFRWGYDPAPESDSEQGAGSVHHIAWASRDDEHGTWRDRVRDAGGHVTNVIDRDYFLSIYFREPTGVLFEIATMSPGFAVDEDPDHLGEELQLPRMYEQYRDRLERTLTPLVNPRTARRQGFVS